MNKKLAIAMGATATVITLSYLLSDTAKTEQHSVQVSDSAPHSHQHQVADLSDQPVYRNGQVLSTGKNMLKPKQPSRATETDETGITERDSIIWQESDESKEVLQASGFMPSDVEEEAYIEVDLEELLTVELGESLDLYIPQLGGSYNGEVDHIDVHPNGDRTVEAFIPGAGTLYSAVITIGENAIYGNIATQEDVFILEGIGKHAWIAPKSAMIAKHKERVPTPSPANDSDGNDPFKFEKPLSPTTSNNN